MIPFTMTNDSIVVIYQGKSHTVQKNQPQFTGLKRAIITENWDDIPNHLSLGKSLASWAKGRFTYKEIGEVFSYDGRELPSSVNQRIITMATKGEDPTPMFNFFERLNRNPSMRSVEQLYPFLQHTGISITPDGFFLAYKGVRDDYRDCHSGKIDNTPGQVVKVPRNQVSDDPQQACHFGLHAGSKSYAAGYGTRLTVVKIDPEHVVCVPYDSSQKLRCCEYVVIGNAGDELPSTIHEEQELPPDEPMVNEEEDVEEDVDVEMHDDGPTEYDEGGPDDGQGRLFDINKGEFIDETKDEKSPPLEKTGGGMEIPKKYQKKAGMEMEELIKLPLDELRELATYGLKIIGASKIPGGKSALVARIMQVRDAKE